MSVEILLVDDQNIVRNLLGALIKNTTGMEVVAEAENGLTAIKLARQFEPDVIVMDIIMPELNGIDATCRIVEEFPGTKVIALSMYSDEHMVAGMLEAGASGYLLKDQMFEELIISIRTVLDNEVYLSPQIEGSVSKDIKKNTCRNNSGPQPR
jgi:DNA-binding NarL/FixJ family response regulator